MCRFLPMLFLLAIFGCASGFDRTELISRLSDTPIQINDEEIAQVRALRPQLSFPCNIAVYMAGNDGYQEWRWTAKDKQILESWGTTLQREGIAAKMFLISDMFVGEAKDLKSLRLAAAKYGADALLVIKGAAQTDGYMNPAAVFNLTVVGGFLVPGSRCDALFMVQGALVDVGNGFVYASAESEGEGSIIRPTFIIEEKVAVDRAKERALENLGPEFVRRMRNLQRLGSTSTTLATPITDTHGPALAPTLGPPSAIGLPKAKLPGGIIHD